MGHSDSALAPKFGLTIPVVLPLSTLDASLLLTRGLPHTTVSTDMRMKRGADQLPSVPSPTKVIGSIFRVRRDLSLVVKKHVLQSASLTLEEADVLMDLFGASKLAWEDPVADEDGYVAFAALRRSLVHSSSSLSRRIAALLSAGLVETLKPRERARAGEKADLKVVLVRITKSGVAKISPVYERFRSASERLLRDIPIEDQVALVRINEQVMKAARWAS